MSRTDRVDHTAPEQGAKFEPQKSPWTFRGMPCDLLHLIGPDRNDVTHVTIVLPRKVTPMTIKRDVHGVFPGLKCNGKIVKAVNFTPMARA